MSIDEKTPLQTETAQMQTVETVEKSTSNPDMGSAAGKSKQGNLFTKLGAPVNKIANSLGSQAFWPMALDKESEKAAKILQSFASAYMAPLAPLNQHFANSPPAEGVYTESAPVDGDNLPAYSAPVPKDEGKACSSRVLVRIPQRVLRNAIGLAIFSTVRAGFHASLSSGSGVLIARLPDGSWSPPSGILVHSMGVGFNFGFDMYDCVVVINTQKGLEAFSRTRASLSGELSAAVGPIGGGGMLDADFGKDPNRSPLLMYMKSRGLYLGVQVNGTIIRERDDENARFYGRRIPVADILAGHVQNVSAGAAHLRQVAKGVEGTVNADDQALPNPVNQPASPAADDKSRMAAENTIPVAVDHEEVRSPAYNEAEDYVHVGEHPPADQAPPRYQY